MRWLKWVLISLVVIVLAAAGGMYASGNGLLLQVMFAMVVGKPDTPFNPADAVAAPDYSLSQNWAALPEREDLADLIPAGIPDQDLQGSAPVDVFFIHPTGFTKGTSWTFSMDPDTATEENTRWMLANQASAYNGCCNIYAPRYRQASLFTYFSGDEIRQDVLAFAYQDVASAFQYFLDHYSKGKPFIIASHSQGTHHGARLLKDVIDGTPLAQRMVAAYLIGGSIAKSHFDGMQDVSICQSANDLNCAVHWDTFSESAIDNPDEDAIGNLCVNPLSWQPDGGLATRNRHQGGVPPTGKSQITLLGSDEATGVHFGPLQQPIKNLVQAQCADGILYISDLAGTPFGGLAALRGNYHGLDYPVFHMDIRENAKLRVANYLANYPAPYSAGHPASALNSAWGATQQDAPPSTLALISRVDHLDQVAREPMVVRHPSGRLFVAGYPSQVTGTDWTVPPQLWRSDDQGETWSPVDVGTADQGASGNSDVDLAVGPDGTVYFFVMGFNRTTGEGTHMAMGVSHDSGDSWQWHRLSNDRFDDRPWVAVAPNGTVHAIWNDGSGVCHSISRDSGRTWSEQPRIHPLGGSSHLAIGPGGEIAVRISPISASGKKFDEETDFIATSRDDGASWQIHPIPGHIAWDPTFSDPAGVPRWVEPLAWGAGQTLYHLWSEETTVWLGWSTDFAETWHRQQIAQFQGKAFFPYMTASADGDLAATWFVQEGAELSIRVAVIRPGADAQSASQSATQSDAQVAIAPAFTAQSWEEKPGPQIPTPSGEYVPVIFLPGNELGVATPIQDLQNNRWGFSWWRFGFK